MSDISRRAALQLLGLTFAAGAARAAEADPIMIGVSGPLTGQYAQYGVQWKRGFDLALEHIPPIDGRKLQYDFEDSQSDPRQAVGIAQKFIADPSILVEVGDFSSAASMAASPIYQRGKLVQFGFTNSHPDFTKGGDYMWTNAPSQADDMPVLVDYAVKTLKLKRLAVLYIDSDWGRTSEAIFTKGARANGAEVVAQEGYLPTDKDFRSTLVRVRDANPDGIILVSYYPDGALITRQIRSTGLKQAVVACSSVYSPKFLELGGDAVNGVYTETAFFPGDPRPVARTFVAAYVAKYQVEPDNFSARAYDTFVLLSEVMRQFGATRQAIRDGLEKIKDVPSVVYGAVTFDPATRRVSGPSNIPLIVKDGKFVAYTGGPATISN